MGDKTSDELRADLKRVQKERDDYRAMLAELVKRHYKIDLDELEADLLNFRINGGLPFSAVTDMLEREFGIKL